MHKRKRGAHRRAERGIAVVEFALALPALLVLSLGFLSLAMFLLTRFHLSAAAVEAARTCTIMRNPSVGCAMGELNRYQLGMNMRLRCGMPVVQQLPVQVVSGTGVQVFRIQVTCPYSDNIAARFLAGLGVAMPNLIVRAAMPYYP